MFYVSGFCTALPKAVIICNRNVCFQMMLVFKIKKSEHLKVQLIMHRLQYFDSTKYLHFVEHSKGKLIPLQAWRGPEGSRRLRLPDFKAADT
jgi:hypothetical protein